MAYPSQSRGFSSCESTRTTQAKDDTQRNAARFNTRRTLNARQAAERAEQDAKAAQKRKDEEATVPMFETTDRELASQLRAADRPQIVRSKRAKDANGRSSSQSKIPSVVDQASPAKREELAAQHDDANSSFERQRREGDEALSTR